MLFASEPLPPRIRVVRENVGSLIACEKVGFAVSSDGGVGQWKGAVVDGNGCGHDPLAVGSHTVETMAWNFGDQALAAEFGDLAAHIGAAAFGFDVVGG